MVDVQWVSPLQIYEACTCEVWQRQQCGGSDAGPVIYSGTCKLRVQGLTNGNECNAGWLRLQQVRSCVQGLLEPRAKYTLWKSSKPTL